MLFTNYIQVVKDSGIGLDDGLPFGGAGVEEAEVEGEDYVEATLDDVGLEGGGGFLDDELDDGHEVLLRVVDD